jgi:putative flippase GtrA
MISRETATRLFRYVLAGGTAAVVDLTIFTTLQVGFGLPVPLAACCSFLVAAVVNYTLSSVFVFGHALSVRQLAMFVGVALMGLTINVGVTVAADNLVPFAALLERAASVVGLAPGVLGRFAAAPAKVCGIGVAFLFNFYLNSTVVFRARPQPAAARSGAT